MLESRNLYGWNTSGTGVISDEQAKRWIIMYRTKDGGLGEVGYKTFRSYFEATEFGEEFKRENTWVTDFWVRHPNRFYSTY